MDNVNEIEGRESQAAVSVKKDDVRSGSSIFASDLFSVRSESGEGAKSGVSSSRENDEVESGFSYSGRQSVSARARIKAGIQDFLEEESRNLPTEASGVKYDLAEEYSATKSNGMKNFIPILLWMAAAFVFVGIMACTIVTIVNRQNSRISVEVESFDSLNLSKLLDLVSGTQQQINEESANREKLEEKKRAVLEQAESVRKSSLATLESMNIKDASELRKMKAEIQSEYEASVASVSEIDAQIAESDAKIALYQQQLAQYDTATVQQAREHQAEMDSEKQLHQLEKQRISSEYEGKISDLQKDLESQHQVALEKQQEMVDYVIGQYDPTFSDDRAAQAVVGKMSLYASRYVGSNVKLDDGASEEFKSALKGQNDYFNQISTLSSRFQRLPQKNAIPKFAQVMQRLANTAGNDLASASVAEINKLMGINRELSEKNLALEGEKSEMSVQIEGLETERNELIERNGTLSEEKIALETENKSLSSEKSSLSATFEALSGENASLSTANESLASQKSALELEVEKLNKEKESWNSLRTSLEEQWASEKAELLARQNELSSGESSSSLSAEKESLASANAELTAETKRLKEENDRLSAEKAGMDEQNRSLREENKSLASERDSLAETNRALSSQGNQYSDLLQTFCVRDGKKIQGFVSGKSGAKRIQLYVEKSAYSSRISKSASDALIPVAIIVGGKVSAVGKISVENGAVFMVKGSEEELSKVESLLNFDGTNDYSSVNLGDEIQIYDPL